MFRASGSFHPIRLETDILIGPVELCGETFFDFSSKIQASDDNIFKNVNSFDFIQIRKK